MQVYAPLKRKKEEVRTEGLNSQVSERKHPCKLHFWAAEKRYNLKKNLMELQVSKKKERNKKWLSLSHALLLFNLLFYVFRAYTLLSCTVRLIRQKWDSVQWISFDNTFLWSPTGNWSWGKGVMEVAVTRNACSVPEYSIAGSLRVY